MSLTTKIEASEQRNSFIVYDCTGIYKYDNLGGWGAPNEKIADVISSVLEITSPSNPNPYTIDVFPYFPNLQNGGIEILPSQVGQANNEIESGEWIIKWTIQVKNRLGETNTYTSYYSAVFTHVVTCCIDKRVREVKVNGYKDVKQQIILELSNLLESVKNDIEHGFNKSANNIIKYLKEQCNCCDCQNGLS